MLYDVTTILVWVDGELERWTMESWLPKINIYIRDCGFIGPWEKVGAILTHWPLGDFVEILDK